MACICSNFNACGNCKHWHKWDLEREQKYWNNNSVRSYNHNENSLHFGDCDKVAKGTVLPDGYRFDGYSFEDEVYDEDLCCFESYNTVNLQS